MGLSSLRISKLWAAALVCFSFGSAALAQQPNPPKPPVRGGTAIVALSQNPATINPLFTTAVPDQTIGCMIYQGLTDIGLDFRPKPVLAKSWTVSPDGLTYSFELVKTTWQDGKPFTSDDVKYSLIELSAKYSAIFRSAANVIDTIETPAPDKVVIKLKKPFGPFLLSLACERGGGILPAHLYRDKGDPKANPVTGEQPVGTGPFKFGDRKHGEYVRVVRNPTYWEPGKPYLDEIVIRIITQPSSRMQALEAGEIDFVPTFPVSSKVAVLGNPKLKIVDSDSQSSNILFFNLQHKPLDIKKVRQALHVATDRDYLIKNTFFDVGVAGKNPFTTDIGWIANPAVDLTKMYAYDPARANAMLDEAGVKRGADGKRFPIKIVTYANEFPELVQTAIALKSMWAQVGVDVTVEQVETATILRRVFFDRDFDVHLNAYGTYSDPALGIARAYVTTPGGIPNGNPSGYSNPVVDDLFEKGERGTTLEERGKFYQELQAIIAEDVPAIALRQYTPLNAMSAKLWGIYHHAYANGRYGEGWLEK